MGDVNNNNATNAAGADDEEQQRVTAHSYGALDVTHANDECWMVRFPTKLAGLLEKVQEGTEIGQLVFTKGGTRTVGRIQKQIKPSLTVHISDTLVDEVMAEEKEKAAAAAASNQKKPAAAGGGGAAGAATAKESSTMPLHYSLQAMTKKIPVMHPFTRNPNNGSVEILGQVSRTANLQVEQDDSYRELLKDRLVQTNITSSRFVKSVEATESVMNKQQQARSNTTAAAAAAASSSQEASKKKTFGNSVLQFGKRMLEATQESSLQAQQLHQQQLAGGAGANKKSRQFSPDQPIRSVIFELFGRQQYWTVKDLKSAAVAGGFTTANTKRVEAEMRDVLREIGEYHRSGDHKNMWELRKEFQQQS